jgi:hypothetical protein
MFIHRKYVYAAMKAFINCWLKVRVGGGVEVKRGKLGDYSP